MKLTAVWTALALLSFAGNSILTRLALGGGHLDAASFTAIRLCAGALVLGALAWQQDRSWAFLHGKSFIGPVSLFAYAAAFSYAYLRIGAALGALVLFAAVQITMLSIAIVRGDKHPPRVYLGLLVALASLACLTLPAAARPEPVGTLFMVLAGIAWGIYTLFGKSSTKAIASNARSFALALPLCVPLALALPPSATASVRGVLLAALSGAVTSGLGYAIWYRALRGLGSAQAALLQLLVPVIAAAAAVVVLNEQLSPRLVLAGAGVLMGVALALVRKPAAR